MRAVQFEILPPVRHPDEPVAICGNLPELGGWNAERAFPLKWQPPFHVGELKVADGVSVEYKILRESWETEAVGADGKMLPNFAFVAASDAKRFHAVADWKDRFAGKLISELVPSRVFGCPREVAVWLPPGYSRSRTQRFPVAIFSDGCNVFDPATSCFGIDWAADESFLALSCERILPEYVVVAVCHPKRLTPEGAPIRNFELSPQLEGPQYAQFLRQDLIPYLETRFRLIPSPEARLLVGASLGALFAFHFAMHIPGVFSRFACLSTSFEDYPEVSPRDSPELNALAALPQLPRSTRIFFDYGTLGRDECYGPYHARLAEILHAKGWTNQYTIRRIEGGFHSELSWRQRLGDALKFLFLPSK